MSRHPQSACSCTRRLLIAASVLATVSIAAAPAIQAAPAANLTVAGAAASAAGSGVAAADRAALRGAPLRSMRWQGAAAAARSRVAAGLRAPAPRPQDDTTGLFIIRPGATWSGSTGEADLTALAIENNNASGTATGLALSLFATTALPVEADGISGYDMASAGIGDIPAGESISNEDTGEIAFAEPPPGCYYVTLVLSQGDEVLDLRTFANVKIGVPQTNGYDIVPFPDSTSCPAATSCTRTGTSACLDSARFQVTAVYGNDTTGHGSSTVLSFGSTRAESDESVFYYFTDPSNFELGVKVLDACAINNFFWVFIGGLTNQGFSVNVLDTQTANIFHTTNTEGTTVVTVTNTSALPCP